MITKIIPSNIKRLFLFVIITNSIYLPFYFFQKKEIKNEAEIIKIKVSEILITSGYEINAEDLFFVEKGKTRRKKIVASEKSIRGRYVYKMPVPNTFINVYWQKLNQAEIEINKLQLSKDNIITEIYCSEE